MKTQFAILIVIASSYFGYASNICTLYGNDEDFVIECRTVIKSMDYTSHDGSVLHGSDIHIIGHEEFIKICVKGPYVAGHIYSMNPSTITVHFGNSQQQTFLLDSTYHNISLLSSKRNSAIHF